MRARTRKLKTYELPERLVADLKKSRKFRIVGADLSLSYPAWALLECDVQNRRVELIRTVSCDNRQKTTATVGERLVSIANRFIQHIYGVKIAIYCRERAFSKYATETQNLNKVVGVMDYIIASRRHRQWLELPPTTVKCTVARSGKADKNAVARATMLYVGEQKYPTDNESDAVAVALAALIKYGFIDAKNTDFLTV